MQEEFEDEALDRLSKVFGFETLPHETHHRSPPQYMQDLFNSVAYSDGISKSANPYDADVVRGFPDRGEHCFPTKQKSGGIIFNLE